MQIEQSPNLLDMPISSLSQDLLRAREVIDTFVKERLSQAAKTNKNWCSSYNKMFNVGWIIGPNSIFFFQYLASQNTVNRSLVEFPKNQHIETPDKIKIFRKNKDLYALVVFPNTIQIAKILAPTEEKDVVESLRFLKQNEKIAAVSESWDEGDFVYFTVSTNKNSLYLIQLEIKVLELRMDFSISTHLLNRKTKLLQRIKSYITPDFDIEGQTVFCHMQRRVNDPSRASLRTYNVFSYIEGKLELLTMDLELQKGKLFPVSHAYKWVVNLESILQTHLGDKLYENLKKLREFEILDLVPEMYIFSLARNSSQVILRMLLRVTLVNHTYLEGYFSLVNVRLDEGTGDVAYIEERIIDDGFKLDLQRREQVYYGRIVAAMENNTVYVCLHFSLKASSGMLETEETQFTHTNVLVEADSTNLVSRPVKGKLLGAGHYFDYEQNEEDVLLVITEIDVIKMKVLQHMRVSQGLEPIKQSGGSMAASLRPAQAIRRNELERPQMDVESITSFSVGNYLSSKFREMLGNARDNFPAFKIEVDDIMRKHNPKDIWQGLSQFTNEILRAKNRNITLASTYISPKKNKKKEAKPEASDILLHEMKKKHKILNAWIEFLKKFSLWDIQDPIRELVYSTKEKLLAAMKLRELQISLNSLAQEDNVIAEKKGFLFEVILECLCKWGLEAKLNSEYVNNDIFYTKIENFSDFVMNLVTVQNTYIENNKFQYLTFVTETIITMFDALYEERQLHNYESLGLWTQDENLLSKLFLLLEGVITALGRGELEIEGLKTDLSRLGKPGYILIREYNNLSRLSPDEPLWKNEIDKVYTRLLDNGIFNDCGKYAEEFTHCHIVGRLYYEYNYDYHIKDLFKRWSDLNFLENFIDDYVLFIKEKPNKATGPFKLFLDFDEFNQHITEYVSRKYPQIAWLLLLKNGELINGQRTLKKVTAVENYVRNRLAEASMGRLSVSFYQYSSEYDKLLNIDMIQYQSSPEQGILSPQDLIATLLKAGNKDNAEFMIRKCLKVLTSILNNSYYNNLVSNDIQKMLVSVVLKAIAFDKEKIESIEGSILREAPQKNINDKVSETCLWKNFDDLLKLVEGQEMVLENFIEEAVGAGPQVRIVIKKMRALKESRVRIGNEDLF